MSGPTEGRIRLISCNDAWTTVMPGDLGTVTLVDDMGTVHVQWDKGSRLGLIPGEDVWETAPTT